MSGIRRPASGNWRGPQASSAWAGSKRSLPSSFPEGLGGGGDPDSDGCLLFVGSFFLPFGMAGNEEVSVEPLLVKVILR